MINKDAIKSQITATIRNIEVNGEDQVDSFVDIIVDAIINEILTNGEFRGTITGGPCTYSGSHPPSQVSGKIY